MSGKGLMNAALDWALDRAIASKRVFLVNDLAGRRVSTPVLLTASQTLVVVAPRTSLTAVGPEIQVDGFSRVTLWGTLTPNAMTGIRFACYARHTTGGTNHCIPTFNPSVAAAPYYMDFTPEEIRWADAANPVNFALTWDIGNTIPFIQFGCAATADPGVDAVLTNVYVTYGWGS